MTTISISNTNSSESNEDIYVFSGQMTPNGYIPPDIKQLLPYVDDPVIGRLVWQYNASETNINLSINSWEFQIESIQRKTDFFARRSPGDYEPEFAYLNTNSFDNYLQLSGTIGDTTYGGIGIVTIAKLAVNGKVDYGTVESSTKSPQLTEYIQQKTEESIKRDEAIEGILSPIAYALKLNSRTKIVGTILEGIAIWAGSSVRLGKQKLLNDPPDPNYQIFQAPVDKPFTPLSISDGLTQEQAALFNDLLQNALAQASLYDVTLKTFDKSAGAELAGDEFWRHQQLLLADEYLDQTSLLLEEEKSVYLRLESFLNDIGLPDNIQVNFDQALEEILSQDYSFVPINEVASVIAFIGDSLDSLQGQTLNVSSVFAEKREATQTLADALTGGTLKPANIYVNRESRIVGGSQNGRAYTGVLTGTSRNDFIVGSFGKDSVSGAAGSDRIYTGVGNDTIDAGAGNDTVDGGGGRDTLLGGTGKDTLIGGAGSDTFVFSALSHSRLAATDVITDYGKEDRIDAPSSISATSANPTVLKNSSGKVTSLTSAAISAVLTKTLFTANSAQAFTVNGQKGTFVAMNDATPGFSATTDSVIHLANFNIGSASTVTII